MTENIEMKSSGEDDEEIERPDPALKAPDLYLSVKENNTQQALELMNERVPPFYLDKKTQWTALHWAAVHGNVKLVRKLLELGAQEKYHNQIARLEIEKNGGMENLTIEERTALEEQMENNREDLKIDYLKNTPLLWASLKGHMEIVWLLLEKGYSPNDTDNLGNTALHLAAASGHKKIVQALIDDGAMPTVVNIYLNPPSNMAKDKEIREMLLLAVEKNASMTSEDIKKKHEDNRRRYKYMVGDLNSVVQDAGKIESPRSSKSFSNVNMGKLIQKLSDVLRVSEEWSIDEEMINQGKKYLSKLEITLDMISDLTNLQKKMPIRTQSQYLEFAQKLEETIDIAEKSGIERAHLQLGRDLLNKCQVELHLCLYINRLSGIECAVDANEYDMKKLKGAIQKAEAMMVSEEIIDEGNILSRRLEAELSMTRAISSIPVVRLPPLPVRSKEHPEGIVPEMPPEYWQESDIGRIIETEEFPKPPAEFNGNPNTTGEYIWESSLSLRNLRKSIELMKSSLSSCGGTGANEALITSTKEHLVKAEKEAKALDAKDLADKMAAVEIAIKAAKKLKGKKGGKK